MCRRYQIGCLMFWGKPLLPRSSRSWWQSLLYGLIVGVCLLVLMGSNSYSPRLELISESFASQVIDSPQCRGEGTKARSTNYAMIFKPLPPGGVASHH